MGQTAKIQLQPAQNAAGYPLLPDENSKVSAEDFQVLSTSVDIDLDSLPIVKKVLETGEPLRGVECEYDVSRVVRLALSGDIERPRDTARPGFQALKSLLVTHYRKTDLPTFFSEESGNF